MSPVPSRPARGAGWLTGWLLRFLGETLLWAVPFALFFGTLYGRGWGGYRRAYLIAWIFAAVIRAGTLLAGHVLVPRLLSGRPRGERGWLPEAAIYFVVAVGSSYVAAGLAHQLVVPDFLGSPRAWLVSGLFSVVFALLVGGIIYARVFYRTALARAVALERMRAELARAELRALRAQVNPHFLFNTLNTIAALIAENPAAAEDVVTRLADVFRHALTASSREHTRLADELGFMRDWLAIERARFGPRLRVVEEVEPGLDDVPVPGLLFQPLIENAVRYAVASRPEGGTITLRVRRDDAGRTLTAEVGDDGPGFEPGAPPAGHGVGLESVRERLRLGGEGHGFALETAPGHGTCVRITLPLAAPATPGPAHAAGGTAPRAAGAPIADLGAECGP